MDKKYSWNNVKNLPVLPWIPDTYNVDEKLLFRTPLTLINHLYWKQLIDYEFYNQINDMGDTIITVHGYYTSSIHQLYKAYEMKIPANSEFNEEIIIRNYSRIRNGSVKQSRLENSFSRYDHKELENYISNFYLIKDLTSYCSKSLENQKIKLNIKPAPFNRVFVIWTVDLVIGLYREDLEGNLSLVGCSDYYLNSFPQLYPESNNYWVERTSKEKSFVQDNYEEQQFCSIYIPGMNPIKIKEVSFDLNEVEEDKDEEN